MIDYDTSDYLFSLIARWKGSVAPRSALFALPSACLTVALMLLNDTVPDLLLFFGSESVTSSQLWSALTAVLAFSITFRTNKAYSRFWEGNTLLHQMRGEWFDSVSCLIAFSSLAKSAKPKEVSDFRHVLVRLMSLCHGSALEEIQAEDSEGSLDYLDMGGLDEKTLQYLGAAKSELNFNRVEVLIHMMQNLIVHGQDKGILKIPPPILSRVFQTLSRGQVNLMNCKKIKSTLFPFPYVQVISILLFALSAFTPCVMSGLFDELHWGFLFTFIPLFGLCALNYTACELEMPFGEDSNDLPISFFQEEMNQSMMMLIREETDHTPSLSLNAVKDVSTISESVTNTRHQSMLMRRPVAEDTEACEKDEQSMPSPPAPPSPSPPQVQQPAGVTVPPIPANIMETTLQAHMKQVDVLCTSFQSMVERTSTLSDILRENTMVMKSLAQDLPGALSGAHAVVAKTGSLPPGKAGGSLFCGVCPAYTPNCQSRRLVDRQPSAMADEIIDPKDRQPSSSLRSWLG
mmetsp:Transcript_90128/g.160516  ORF Transcript_90128/g.160516 Transcript_90128/m.160516 type:complete len:517 (-) Transcript_90128:101-1651(-)